MLEKLLRCIAEGGAHNLAELVREVGVDEELLRPMIAELVRLGYLRPVTGSCQEACASCPFLGRSAGGCERVQLWELTAKGVKAARSAR